MMDVPDPNCRDESPKESECEDYAEIPKEVFLHVSLSL
jgi:hypothetical protein